MMNLKIFTNAMPNDLKKICKSYDPKIGTAIYNASVGDDFSLSDFLRELDDIQNIAINEVAIIRFDAVTKWALMQLNKQHSLELFYNAIIEAKANSIYRYELEALVAQAFDNDN